MSYQVIARKWRPQTFEEVTGQEIITQTLRNSLEFDRLHHAYMFSGARGVGKTTTARILAKALNCHKTDKPNLTPCLLTDRTACPSCIEISEGRSMDVLEIDAASHTGIDDVRETIIENITFNPARDRYKVFIVDEVHQLSKPAFNALLKTLEEPPDNVVFVMATTELHKVPETILSRCQEFQFRTIPQQKIFDRLKLIAQAEKIDITDDALRELARSGEGSMRDAQSNFDQVISFSSDQIGAPDVSKALGVAGVDILERTMEALVERQPTQVLAVVDDLITRGHDLRNFSRDLLSVFRDLLVYKVAASEKQLLESAALSEERMRDIGAALTQSDLLRFFNSLSETEMALRTAAHPRYALEMGLVKLIEMRTVASVESILKRLDELAAGVPATAELPVTSNRTAGTPIEAFPEKKTLKPEPEVPIDLSVDEPPDDLIGLDSSEVTVHPVPPPPKRPAETVRPRVSERVEAQPDSRPHPAQTHGPTSRAFTPPPIRLASLTSEELEHFDDPRWDDLYEERLLLTGDDLMPISSADTLVKMLFGEEKPAPQVQYATSNGSATAAKPAFDVAKLKAELSPEPENVELPVLGENPTPEELLEYARAHPAVRAAVRVFRAKIVEVQGPKG